MILTILDLAELNRAQAYPGVVFTLYGFVFVFFNKYLSDDTFGIILPTMPMMASNGQCA